MHIFYANCKEPELRTYCRREGISLTDIFLEMKKSKREKRQRIFKWIISRIRVDEKKDKFGIPIKECKKIAYEIVG